MEKLSIIIPVYNGEKYIKRCIKSIAKQSFKEINLIVIDDGSTDNSYNELLKLKEEYENSSVIRFTIYKKENGGVAKARNLGIEKANSKYIMFVDQDDYIDYDYVETFFYAIENGKADIVVGGFKRTSNDGKVKRRLILRDDEWSKFKSITPWSKIYNLEFIKENKVEFLDTLIGEDIYYNLTAYSKTNNIVNISYIGYNWTFNESSVSNTIQRKITKDVNVIGTLEEVYKSISNEKKENDIYYEYFFIKNVIWYITYTAKRSTNKQIDKEYDKLFSWIKDKYPNYYKVVRSNFPKEEPLIIRLLVRLLYDLDKLKLGKAFLKVYKLL